MEIDLKSGKRGFDSGIYFIECAEFIKVGRAHSVTERFNNLQASCPLRMIPLGFIWEPDEDVAAMTERRIHERFDSVRYRGEWFRDIPELRELIRVSVVPWPVRGKRGKRFDQCRDDVMLGLA